VGKPAPADVSAHVPVPGEAQLLMEAMTVGWRYRGGSREALHDVSLELSRARVTAVTGANGSGKSTLLALLGGLRHPSSGRVVASPALRRGLRKPSPSRWRSRDLAGRVGTVFQNPEHSFIRDTVADEVAVGVQLRASGSEVHDRTEQLLTRLRLDHVAGANPFTLSGGEQRRLSVAAALASRPDVLVLDEPTFGQDPVTWAELVSLVGGLRNDGAAVAMATHDRWFVAALAAEELALEDGTHRPATANTAP
jgi:energy-coupling factor transport system ATP-binding protein